MTRTAKFTVTEGEDEMNSFINQVGQRDLTEWGPVIEVRLQLDAPILSESEPVMEACREAAKEFATRDGWKITGDVEELGVYHGPDDIEVALLVYL